MQRTELKIGFDKVRAMVVGKCSTRGAASMARELEMMTDAGAIAQALKLTDEMRLICMFEDTFPLEDYVDMHDFLLPLSSESSCISLPNLVLLQRGLETIRRVVGFFRSSRDGVYPNLKQMASEVAFFPEVTRKISSILDKYGAVRDTASEELQAIRRQLHEKEKSVARIIASVMKKAQADGLVDMDASVVVREGKTLIPVSAADKHRIQGIVYDESSSGKTSFIEPMEVVAANNAIRELQFEEQREIQRILFEFTDFLRPYLPEITESAEFLVKVDFIKAKAMVALDMVAGMPLISENGELNLRKARHPLLEKSLHREGKEIVPLNLGLTAEKSIILISGPNAGGKSVCLKTVGLLQYMFQCGMLIPTSEVSEMVVFDKIFVDIGDNQSIENDLSTYSSHLTDMRDITEAADKRTLVLIDEFGSGTEPAAGGAIAEAVLDCLAEKAVYGVITTHYTNLKLYASNSSRVVNGAMQFDAAAITPLFSLEQGLPGNSFAFELARKIGLSEEIVKSAEEKAGSDFVDMERQLRKIARNRRALDEKLTRVKHADKTLESLTDRYEKELSEIKELRRNILNEAKAEAKEIVAGANKRIEQTIREIREAQAEKEKTKEARAKVTELQKSLSDKDSRSESDLLIEKKMEQILARKEREAKRKEERARKQGVELPRPKVEKDESSTEPLKVGDKVRIKESEMVGEIIQITAKKVAVAVGSITSRVAPDKVERISASQYKTLAKSAGVKSSGTVAVKGQEAISQRTLNFSPSIDIRGEHLEEALVTVTNFIDDAIMIGIGTVKILHGKGTGVLREEIRKYLKTIPNVKNVRDEDIQFGGAGITVVELD